MILESGEIETVDHIVSTGMIRLIARSCVFVGTNVANTSTMVASAKTKTVAVKNSVTLRISNGQKRKNSKVE